MSTRRSTAALVLARRSSAAGGGRARHRRAERGVAVVAGDLLDDVDLDGGVVAPRRDGDVEVVARPASVVKPIGSSSSRDRGRRRASVPSSRSTRSVRTRTTGRSGGQLAVDATAGDRAATPAPSSSANRRMREVDDLGVGALLEPGRRLGLRA